jgi:CubicO group peptidase (beta-lactamase class C family)
MHRTRTSLAFLAVLLACALTSTPAAEPQEATSSQEAIVWPGAEWSRSTPGAQGLLAAPLEALADDVAAGDFGYVDRLFVVAGGYVVLDRRYEHDYVDISRGGDPEPHQYNYSHPDWHPYYQGSELHTLQSITKSVTSALIGIALDRGEIAGTHIRVLPVFRDYRPRNLDDRKRAILLVNLLTMQSGIEWHETDRPIGPTNTTIQLEASDDWIGFTLDQPMEAAPGTKWTYNSGASQLLSGILRHTTGKHAHEYAQEWLFGPIGIDTYHWKITPGGYADTEGGLYLRAEDLARFGYLFLRDGTWNGAQIVSREWVRMSTTRLVEDVAPNSADDRGYGFQWWRLDRGDTRIWAGLGYGGQYLLVFPDRDVVAVVNSWNIFDRQRSLLDPFIDALLAATEARL